jgi:hypothetical protein
LNEETKKKKIGYFLNYTIALYLDNFVLQNEEVFVGEALVFNFRLVAKEDSKLMIDYIVHFRTKAGKLSPKIHKLKKISLRKGESVTLQKKHHFKANMTTRTLHEGEHKVELQINGKRYASKVFCLHH